MLRCRICILAVNLKSESLQEEEEKEAAKREEEYVQNKKLETLSQLEVGKEQQQPAEP